MEEEECHEGAKSRRNMRCVAKLLAQAGRGSLSEKAGHTIGSRRAGENAFSKPFLSRDPDKCVLI